MYLDRKEFAKLSKVIKNLHLTCVNADGSDDQKKGTLLLEIFALEIQMLTATKNNKKLKALYQQCLAIKAAIPHPKIMGIIRECGGKMHMRQKDWESAQTDFFEAFKNYDEAGSPQRLQCLKYLVLANMLMESQINPFDSQETKPYQNDPEIVAMTNLVDSFQRKQLPEFENILRENKRSIMEDEFIRDYIAEVLVNIQNQVIIQLVESYSKISVHAIASHLKITPTEVETLLVDLIHDDKIKGQIDQTTNILELTNEMYALFDKLICKVKRKMR